MQPARATATAMLNTVLRMSVVLAFRMRCRRQCKLTAAMRCRLPFWLAALGKLVEQVKEQRHKDQCERTRTQHAADDAGAQRVSRVHAGAQRDRQRHAAED